MGTTAKPTATWGVSGTIPEACVKGIVQEISTGEAGIFAQEPDEKGRIIYQVMYDKESTISFTILVASSEKLPAASSSITINDVKYVVRNVNKIEQNKDFQRIRVEAGSWVHCDSCTDESGQTTAPAAS